MTTITANQITVGTPVTGHQPSPAARVIPLPHGHVVTTAESHSGNIFITLTNTNGETASLAVPSHHLFHVA